MTANFNCRYLFLLLVAPVLGLTKGSQKPIRYGRIAAEFCSSSPLHLIDHPSCPPWDPYQPSETTNVDFWRGPHACAGEFCVYSNLEFANGRGIVFLSTARDAGIAARLLASEESSKQLVMEQASLRSNPPFYITEIPGKGLGVIANQTIPKGTKLMAETPVMVLHHSFIDDVPEGERLDLLDKAAEALSPPVRDMFIKQHGHFGGHKIFDILYTNSFQMTLGTANRDHLANFPEVSRFNHDCRPNVVFHINSFGHHTYAARDIYPGMEITISYLDEFRIRSVRQSRALRSWGFSCDCHQCTLPDHLVEESDQRLLRIWEIEQELGDVASGQPLSNGRDTVEELMRLYKKERLQHRIADAFTLAALNYNGLGMKEEAEKYGKWSLEANLRENGPNAPDVAAVKELMGDFEGHWSWMKRVIPGTVTTTITNATNKKSDSGQNSLNKEKELEKPRPSSLSWGYRPLESVEAMCSWLLNL